MISSIRLFKIRIVMLMMVSAMSSAGTLKAETWSPAEFAMDQYRSGKYGEPAAGTDVDSGRRELTGHGAGEEDDQELEELLAVLDEVTQVATKTKMNNDYVPGMVTVLHGEQLEALGVQTVAGAMTMVPGIQVAYLESGEPTLTVRGFSFPFNAGNVKVMLNSIALSRESSGINSSVLLTPIAQVDRIEVIRGPGSSIYGDFAMAGVVNIITRNSGGRLFGSAGDDESLGGGGHYSYRNDVRDFEIGVNISRMDDGRHAAIINRDPDEERYTGVFNLKYKKFRLTAEGVQRDVESRGGPPLGGPPAPPGAAPLLSVRQEDSWAVEGRQAIELGGTAAIDIYLTYLQNSFDSKLPFSEFNGNRIETGLDLDWSPMVNHQMLLSASYADSDIDDASQGGAAVGAVAATEVSGIDRRNYSLGLQDQIMLKEQVSLTLGLRFDDYDDVGSRLTPRIALVYRPADHHIVKAQYSEGFRAPTFWELYRTGSTNENLNFEVMNTTELSYIYRRQKSVGRATLYYSEIDDGIFVDAGGQYGNNVRIEAKGVEVEWEQQFHEKFRWQANLSYNDTRDERYGTSGDESPGVAEWLGNLAFFLQPVHNLMLTGRLLYVGPRYADEEWIDGYEIVDFTISRTNLWKSGVSLRIGVNNIFDEDVVYLVQRANGLFQNEYVGRTWWFQITYDF